MSGLKERGWELVQIKAFTSWINGYLTKRDMGLEDIRTDLSDGIRLICFLELLSGKKVKTKYDIHPASRIQKIQNLHIALQFLEKETDIKLQGIGAEDFADGNLKLILGFLWSLFKRFRIQTIKQDDKSSEEGLLLWCKKTTDGYRDVKVEHFKTRLVSLL
jgi:cortexillin 1/2